MIPYRVSVLAPNVGNLQCDEVKLYATYAESDDEALRNVLDAMLDGWRVDRIVGLLSRFEVEHLGLAYGEVREVSSFTIDGSFLPDDASDAGEGDALSTLH